MAQIAPFPGIHFAPTRVPLSDVIAPPYDVLSPDDQAALYARSPENIVRLILNRVEPGDDSTHNRYTRAAAFLQDALARGVLVRDETPGFYEYLQRFAHPLDPGLRLERRALFVALKLVPYAEGVVLPHEETHPKAKADRLELMRATQANPEPIYGLYEDHDQSVAASLQSSRAQADPLLQAEVHGPHAPHGEEHIVYRHTDPGLLADLQAFFQPRRIWIADGHHRYETALNYQQEMREKGKGKREKEEASTPDAQRLTPSAHDLQPYDRLLIGLSAFEDPGLVVLPTHRLVRNVARERLESFSLQLERYFYVQKMQTPSARLWLKQQVPDEKRLVIVARSSAYALTLRDLHLADAALDYRHSPAWRHLDVTILQALVLDRTLGISSSELAQTSDVAYTRDEDDAVQKVEAGEFQLACLLQNPTVAEVHDVAAAGDKMPQKSTYFYPKLWSGLILRTLT
ncbi:MAG TPA: DUF1015 domain-containing protein [Chthonomonadaceae bacterium]|nr:DUF1015 domain-containing protein [Chthonomonadaceae bacterium]